jgi:hypothetical protein
MFSKKTKSDPNAPPVDRIPLPDLWVPYWLNSELYKIILGEGGGGDQSIVTWFS